MYKSKEDRNRDYDSLACSFFGLNERMEIFCLQLL